jgi:quinol monooxygenase YgiN
LGAVPSGFPFIPYHQGTILDPLSYARNNYFTDFIEYLLTEKSRTGRSPLQETGSVGDRNMILVDARCTIVPERHDDFIREVRDIIPVVRNEAGCIRYELVADVHDPGVFHFIEEWESQKHLDEHIIQPHMQAYFAITSSWNSAPAALKIYEILSSRSVTMDD